MCGLSWVAVWCRGCSKSCAHWRDVWDAGLWGMCWGSLLCGGVCEVLWVVLGALCCAVWRAVGCCPGVICAALRCVEVPSGHAVEENRVGWTRDCNLSEELGHGWEGLLSWERRLSQEKEAGVKVGWEL